MRLFIAADLPHPILDSLSGIRQQLDPEGSYARWLPKGALHLTLKFLGEVNTPGRERIEEALDGVRRAAFNVTLSGVGFFPSARSPRVFWLGISSVELKQLAEDIEKLMVNAGFPPEKRRFAPHLTLARGSKKGRIGPELVRNARQLAAKTFGTFRIDRYYLYHSLLLPSGAVYNRLNAYNLTDTDTSDGRMG